VEAAGRFSAINAGTPFDQVEVELENALLAEHEFGHRDERGLSSLAQEGAAGSEEEVFNQLLRKRGASARASAFHVFLGGEFNRLPIESMVLVEARVFRGDHSMLQMGRDLAEGNEVAAFAIRRAVNP